MIREFEKMSQFEVKNVKSQLLIIICLYSVAVVFAFLFFCSFMFLQLDLFHTALLAISDNLVIVVLPNVEKKFSKIDQ